MKKNVLSGNDFLEELENKLIEENGEKEHQKLKSKYEKELEIITAINKTRKTRKLSQAKIGDMLGVSQQRISEIETNSRSLTLPKFLELMEALDLEIDIVDKKNHKKICKI
ncbi:MAG: helix-turn-helix domain-containing protein [Bacillota bacterium]